MVMLVDPNAARLLLSDITVEEGTEERAPLQYFWTEGYRKTVEDAEKKYVRVKKDIEYSKVVLFLFFFLDVSMLLIEISLWLHYPNQATIKWKAAVLFTTANFARQCYDVKSSERELESQRRILIWYA